LAVDTTHYDSTSGNFLTPDDGAGVTRQPYSYAGDSPLNAGGLSGQLPSLSGTPEPTPDLLHRVAATVAQSSGDFLGETHDDLVSSDPLHVTLRVVNSFVIAAAIFDAGVGVAGAARAIAVRSLVSSGRELAPAVIGEDSARVEAAAREIGGVTYRASDGLTKVEALAENRLQIETWKAEGRQILDIGPAPGSTRHLLYPEISSPYYYMERLLTRYYRGYAQLWIQ
jgi:hypothetical protein